MKAAMEGNDFPAPGGALLAAQARELAGRLVGFQTTVTEERLAFECVAIESLGQLDLRLGVERVADMPELVRLFRRRLDQGRMTVS